MSKTICAGEAVIQLPAKADEQFIKLTTWLRMVYVQHYRRYMPNSENYGNRTMVTLDGGEDRLGRRFKSVWARLAELVTKNNFDPTLYIAAQFDTPGRAPHASELTSEAGCSRYRIRTARLPEELAMSKISESLSVAHRVKELEHYPDLDEYQRIVNALNDHEQVSASPLMRYCLASQVRAEGTMRRYSNAALWQYVFAKDYYDAAWTGLLPDELVQRATNLRKQYGY